MDIFDNKNSKWYSYIKETTSPGAEAAKRATVDTAIDTAVGGAVQAAFTAAGTALIPIPGVGKAVGVAAGLLVNSMLTKGDEDTGESVMDKIKGWFH